MKLIWTKSKSPLSWLIRWGLKEPVSHFAIVFDEKIVFHSNLLGTHIEWYNTFKKKNEIVFELDYNFCLDEEEVIYQEIINRFDDKGYDFGAFSYFVWRGFLLRAFNKPMPKTNPWGSPDLFLCEEMYNALKSVTGHEIENLDMMSPYQLYLELSKDKWHN